MKIAICFHGLSAGNHTWMVKANKRRFGADLSMNGLNRLRENYQTDVFIHTWNDENIKILRDQYSPKMMEIEIVDHEVQSKVLMIGRYSKNCIILKNISDKDCQNYYSKYSNYYSMNRVNQLRKIYQEKEQIVYDCVIHTRFDILFNLDGNFKKYNLRNKIYIMGSKLKFEKRNPPLILDYLFFSSPELMDLFCQIYDHLPKMIKILKTKPLRVYVDSNHHLLSQYCYLLRKDEIGSKLEIVRRDRDMWAEKISIPESLPKLILKFDKKYQT